MQKLYIISALIVGVAFGTQAQFTDPAQTVMTIEQIEMLNDDAPVVLQGKIESALGDEKYQFSDETGTIIVEIDDDKWNNVRVTPNDTIQIRGELDKGWMTNEIDVDEIIKQ